MLLTVDIGNTNIVLALFNELERVHCWRMRSNPECCSDEYAAFMKSSLSLRNQNFSDISEIIVASVVPQACQNFERFCHDYLEAPLMRVGLPPLESFIDVRIDYPNQAGADRLVNAWTCHRTYGGDCIVVDFGTATTFDVIDDQGAYHGGVIAPGPYVSLRALHAMTAQLSEITIIESPPVIGKSTLQAQQSGIYWGYHGLVTGIIAQIRESWPRPLHTVATGGLAKLFTKAGLFDVTDDYLTINGLALLAKTYTRG